MSCSTSSDDILENQQVSADLEPAKAFVHYMDFPKITSLYPSWYHTFNYENGKLVKMSGKVALAGTWLPNIFFPDSVITLSYNNNNNKVTLKNSDNPYTAIVYTMESNRLEKSELFDNDLVNPEVLMRTRTYTYESNKINVYEDEFNKNREAFTTYFFDSNKNLIKSEKLEKSGGVDMKFTTTTYSDFDNAKNPFKKIFLVNDNFYEKSLSVNNFRKVEGTIHEFYNPNNYPDGNFMSQWTYQYDTIGQVLLYHPL